MNKIKRLRVGILGATGMVGQNFIRLLQDHPWFEISYLAASQHSAGKKYQDAVSGRWVIEGEIPEQIRNITVQSVLDVEKASKSCDFVFSAFNLDKKKTRDIEALYANQMPVVSNNSAHRSSTDVPMIIPEVNPEHLDIISAQQLNRGWEKGFIVVKPNCSIQSFIPPVHALISAGYPVESILVTTLQAVSGAGYPGMAALDLIDNVIPHINGEEEKSENEPLKILGEIQGGKFVDLDSLTLSVQCNRVPVRDGHLASVSLKFKDPKPSLNEIKEIWKGYTGAPQTLDLPSAPHPPIVVRNEINRPQPALDRDTGKGMAITVGRLKECPILDIRFTALSHNTIRGAAGGAILSAELLKAKGYIQQVQ